ncbi:uncharacterized protein [Haliotis asinina]|uniref:uncharacterized protein n=1 Tax=Haliotis asinina TaxID=109174 RepID=UPI0035319249
MEAKIDTILKNLETNQRELHDALEIKISALREEFSQTTTDLKKLKSDKDYVWSKEGNKIQYNFNEETIQSLQHAIASVHNQMLEDAEAMIRSEIERLKLRNKPIRIADSSEGGWETVRQYVSNELADNSDDDRAIFRANSRAVRKLRQKRGRYAPYASRAPRRTSTVTRPVQQLASVSNGPQHIQSVNQPFRTRGQRSGACFACGEFTHFRRDCPYTCGGSQGTQTGKYEQGMSEILVKGRLKSCFAFWKSIGSSKFVLDIIENGYKIPFLTRPPNMFSRNNQSAIRYASFVTKAIDELKKKKMICECDTPPVVANPLSVSVQSSGKKRLILDLSKVNDYVLKSSMKYDYWRTALFYIRQNDYSVKFDIHSAYHHFDISSSHTELLGFAWPDSTGRIHFYKFLVLPFGLTSTPYVFTKVTRQLVRKSRAEGYRLVTFLDDGILSEDSNMHTLAIGSTVKEDIIAPGFVPKSG